MTLNRIIEILGAFEQSKSVCELDTAEHVHDDFFIGSIDEAWTEVEFLHREAVNSDWRVYPVALDEFLERCGGLYES